MFQVVYLISANTADVIMSGFETKSEALVLLHFLQTYPEAGIPAFVFASREDVKAEKYTIWEVR